MTNFEFPFKGSQFTLTLGGDAANDTIQVQYPGDSNKYKVIIGDILRVSKADKQVAVAYQEETKSVNPEGDKFVGGLHFHVADPMCFKDYHDKIYEGKTGGITVSKMIVNCMLMHKHGLHGGVFRETGEFAYPIACEIALTDNTKEEPVLDVNGNQVLNEDGTLKTTTVVVSRNLKASPADPLTHLNADGTTTPEVYTYTLTEVPADETAVPAVVSNTTGSFDNLAFGSYSLKVESPASMSCTKEIAV